MEKKFLEDLGIEKAVIDQIMDENSKDIGRERASSDALKSDNESLKSQLADRNKDIEALQDSAGNAEQLKARLSDLQTKYDADMQTYQQQISDRDYNEAVRLTISEKSVKFSSKSAEKAFIADLKEKGLKLDSGKLLGFDDYLEQQRQVDPNAFETNEPAPQFSRAGGAGGAKKDIHKMSYSEMCTYLAENPNAQI